MRRSRLNGTNRWKGESSYGMIWNWMTPRLFFRMGIWGTAAGGVGEDLVAGDEDE